MGYVFGQPLLVKTNNGRWSVIVERRLQRRQRAAGHAFLFVIDAETGTLVAKIDTGSGTAASPNGLSAAGGDRHQRRRRRRHGLRRRPRRQPVEVRPLQHLAGKLGAQQRRRCRCSPPAPATPITGRPDVTQVHRRRLPGRLRHRPLHRHRRQHRPDDAAHLRGPRHRHRGHRARWPSLQQQSIAGTGTGATATQYRFSTHAVGPPKDYSSDRRQRRSRKSTYLSDKRGWYLDLPDSGERVVADARFRGGRADLHLDRPRRQLAVRVRRLGLGARVRRDDRQPLRQRDLRQQRRQRPDDRRLHRPQRHSPRRR